jgi:hypothetical protein
VNANEILDKLAAQQEPKIEEREQATEFIDFDEFD